MSVMRWVSRRRRMRPWRRASGSRGLAAVGARWVLRATAGEAVRRAIHARCRVAGAWLGPALLVAAAGCAERPTVRDWIDVKQVQSASFAKYWETSLPLRPGDTTEHAYLIDDNLYVTTAGGDMFAVQADSGLVRWHVHVTAPDYTIYRPSHLQTADGHGPVVVVTTRRLLVFDRYSGEQLHASLLPFPPGGAAVGDATRMYLGSGDGHVYSLLWRHALGSKPLTRWRLRMGAPITTSPVLLGEAGLVFATHGGAVARCAPLDKTLQWGFRAGDGIVADPFVDGTGVYVASTDRSLYKLDLDTGRVVWRRRMPTPLTDPPVVARFACYQYNTDDGLSAIDADTGELKWRRRDGRAFAAAAPGEAVILTSAGTVDVVDDKTGATKRWFDTGGARIATANTTDDTVYLMHHDGRIACLKPEGVPYLRKQEVEAARAFLNRPTPPAREVAAAETAARVVRTADPFRSRRDARP